MASDRYIRWHPRRPTPKKLDPVIRYFFGNGIQIIHENRYWIICLHGTPDSRGLPGHMIPADELYNGERFIEVHPGTKCVDVLTRRADPFVSAIADGLTVFIARALGGSIEEC